MVRDASALIAASALALSLIGLSAPASASDGFWIGPVSGYGGPGDRVHGPQEVTVGAGQEFRTIGEALKAVRPGGIIHVTDGSYYEALKITKPVTIWGGIETDPKTGKRTPTVKIPVPANTDEPCVDVDVPDSGRVTLFQLELDAGPQSVQHSCVELHNGYLSIKDSVLEVPNDNHYVPVVLARGGDLSIERTVVTGGREGILVTSGDILGTYNIVNNTITNNITGVKIDGLADANISGNQIWDNYDTGISYYQGRGTISGNHIGRNGKSQIIIALGRQRPTVDLNTIEQFFGLPIDQIAPSTGGVWAPPNIPESKGEIVGNVIYGFTDDCRKYLDKAIADRNRCERVKYDRRDWKAPFGGPSGP